MLFFSRVLFSPRLQPLFFDWFGAFALPTTKAWRLCKGGVGQGSPKVERICFKPKKTKDDSIDVAQLKMLKEELNRGISLASERIEALEKQNRAIQEVAFNAKDSVLFLQVGVGFKDSKTQQLLRHVVNVDGERLFRPDGRPILTLEGDGPAVEWTSTGTAWFVEYKQTLIVTNHHVVQPEAENFSL